MASVSSLGSSSHVVDTHGLLVRLSGVVSYHIAAIGQSQINKILKYFIHCKMRLCYINMVKFGLHLSMWRLILVRGLM